MAIVDLCDVRYYVLVTQHHTFGQPWCATRVHKKCGVVDVAGKTNIWNIDTILQHMSQVDSSSWNVRRRFKTRCDDDEGFCSCAGQFDGFLHCVKDGGQSHYSFWLTVSQLPGDFLWNIRQRHLINFSTVCNKVPSASWPKIPSAVRTKLIYPQELMQNFIQCALWIRWVPAELSSFITSALCVCVCVCSSSQHRQWRPPGPLLPTACEEVLAPQPGCTFGGKYLASAGSQISDHPFVQSLNRLPYPACSLEGQVTLLLRPS